MPRRIAPLLIAFSAFSIVLPAQVLVRMGTLAPKDSRWNQILLEMGSKWSQATGGKLRLQVYPGGEQGDEPEMVQKMRIHKLQAVALSGAGLSGIDWSVSSLQIPLMFDSYDELDWVRDRIAPRLEKALLSHGYVVLNWADAGWVHFFSKQPEMSPDDFRKIRVSVLQGDSSTFELYKNNGFQPVSLAATDILTGLQTGLIDAFQSPALVALTSQWFGGARNMLDIKFATLVGATLISKDVWDKFPPADQKKILEISRQEGVELRKEIRGLEDGSIGMMQTMGLNVVTATPQARAEWKQLIETKLYPALRAHGMPPDLFDEVKRLSADFEAAHPAQKAMPRAKRAHRS